MSANGGYNRDGMPRRKKSGQSPARVPVGPGDNQGYRLPPGHHHAMANNFSSSSSLTSSDKDNIVKSMREMFSHLDPEVIYIVLSECDFKVENAMDSLLELSVAAEVAAPIPPVSGFERTAAELLSPHHFSEPRTDSDSSIAPQQPPSPTSTSILTDELDLLVDGELERLAAQHEVKDKQPSSPYSSCAVSFSTRPTLPQQALPELLQSTGPSAQQISPVASPLGNKTGASYSLDHISTLKDTSADTNVDFTHLMAEIPKDMQKPTLDLAASGRPSAFQVYKKQGPSLGLTQQVGDVPSDVVVGGAKSKVHRLNQEPLGNKFATWNLGAPVFSPRMHGNQVPTFITPVAQPPFNWPSKPRHLVPVSQAPLKPSATIPKSWAAPGALKHSDQHNRLRLDGKLLVLLRGAPGSGKSTLASALLEHNQGGVVLSTDDYFIQNGEYRFDATFLGEAHEWNHKRAKAAFQRGTNPIIIDNTNMQGWEMKPYVAQALKHGYKVLFREPDTWWKDKPRELQRRTSHNVPVNKIRRMLDGYERFVSVQTIMGSQTPEPKLLENRSSSPKTSEIPCPDLVKQPELIEEFKKSRPQLFSSLPDVSSIGSSSEEGMLKDSTHKSTETLMVPFNEKPIENLEFSKEDDDMDLGSCDSELDSWLQTGQSVRGQGIPDCIVESIMNEDQHGNEIPVAFSESIGQRVRRERSGWRSDFDLLEHSDLVKDIKQLGSKAREEGKDEDSGQVGSVKDEPRSSMPEMGAFVGDWPSQGSLEQRQVRRKERRTEKNNEEANGMSQQTNQNSINPVTEFQKIIDLMQTGAAAIQATSSCLSSPSESHEEESEKEEEADGSSDKSIGSKSIENERRELILNDIDSRGGELPDCVLDQNTPEIINQEELAIKKTGENIHVSDVAREVGARDVTSTNSINPVFITVGDGGGGHSDMVNNDSNVREAGAEVTCSHISGECHSPVCEGSMEADVGIGSQEKKQRHGRRSGKQCKLALTFTQNCPASSSDTPVNPVIAAGNIDSICGFASETDVEGNCDPTAIFSPDLKENLNLLMDSKSDTGCSAQTEPKDFSLLWRLNHRDDSASIDLDVCSYSDLKVLSGDSSRFIPELSSGNLATVAVHPSVHTEVPYRVVHEKGTQVEERDFRGTQDRLESLRILSRHFKLVTFDTLEDLYDKCHQDLDWTTNLLLDSGERFFRDEDGAGGENNILSSVFDQFVQPKECGNVLGESRYKDLPNARAAMLEEGPQQLTCGIVSQSSNSSNNSTDSLCFEGVADPVGNQKNKDPTSQLVKACQAKQSQSGAIEEGEFKVRSEPILDDGAWCGSIDDGVIIEETRVELEEEIASINEVHRLLQAELEESEREEKQRRDQRQSSHLDIQSLELKLPTELALQLAELFGPVGVDPGSCSVDDYAVKMDLSLAKLLHHKWKETIQERQRRAAQKEQAQFLISPDGYSLHDTQPGSQVQLPFMDHWNVSRSHVSLRDIIKEEQALQDSSEKSRKSRADLNQRDGASQFKENHLYSRFPTIDRHFLQDIFRDHNYSLTQTELFLRSLLDEEPVKTVVAPEAPRSNQHRAASREREKRQKNMEAAVLHYQNTEDPDYEDFRAEASLQRSRQLESFSKAAEAFKQGRKEVASFYAQQGRLHGLRMQEANHRAAVQIFERVNSSLLPQNILDLHGLHVNEALEHLTQVLQDKTSDCEQGLCRPQLSVITGRGNHSQGGVARIRPAVIEYLSKKHYRFTEPKPGLVLVSLK